MAERRERPFPRRIAEELGIGLRGRASVQGAEPKPARARHAELAANRTPAMSRADTHSQVTPQEHCSQRTRSGLRAGDLIGMTGVQISRRKPSSQRDGSGRKRITELIGFAVEPIGKEKESACIRLIG